jgi:hypothetical protein
VCLPLPAGWITGTISARTSSRRSGILLVIAAHFDQAFGPATSATTRGTTTRLVRRSAQKGLVGPVAPPPPSIAARRRSAGRAWARTRRAAGCARRRSRRPPWLAYQVISIRPMNGFPAATRTSPCEFTRTSQITCSYWLAPVRWLEAYSRGEKVGHRGVSVHR